MLDGVAPVDDLQQLDVSMRPGGEMADATDLKSVVPKGTCGFESHPGYHLAGDLRTTEGWWALQDLNLQPTDYESAALTIVLRARADRTEGFRRATAGIQLSV